MRITGNETQGLMNMWVIYVGAVNVADEACHKKILFAVTSQTHKNWPYPKKIIGHLELLFFYYFLCSDLDIVFLLFSFKKDPIHTWHVSC